MTREQKVEAFTMKLDGASYQKIADKFGVSKQCIQQILIGGSRRNELKKWKREFIYPNLYTYMIDHEIRTLKDFKDHLGLKIIPAYLGKRLKGMAEFKIDEIQKIIEITGMTFEEAFFKEDRKELKP
jgi:uncharacterized protein YjcR